jgi:hypothetical protein
MRHMTDAEFSAVAERFAFSKVGELSLNGDYLRCSLNHPPPSEHGFVYLWVEISDSIMNIVYVGKAGRTLLERCKQHEGGFRRSSPGLAHADRLRAGLAQNKRYAIYARRSDTKEILGESGISMACAEELAFIQKFKPSWNASPRSRKQSVEAHDA